MPFASIAAPIDPWRPSFPILAVRLTAAVAAPGLTEELIKLPEERGRAVATSNGQRSEAELATTGSVAGGVGH